MTDTWLRKLLNSNRRTLQALSVPEVNDYVLGLNSRVNQYASEHLILLDFDDLSTFSYEKTQGRTWILLQDT